MRISQGSQFKKDIKKQQKKGKELSKLQKIIERLLQRKSLPDKCVDHSLKGRWEGRRDCHVEPDWILIYRITNNELRLEKTGTHSDLF